MPRAYSTLPEPDDDSLPNHRLPDLTYDTAKDLFIEPDYVMVSYKPTKPKSHPRHYDEHVTTVCGNRSKSMHREFYARFCHLFAKEHSFKSSTGKFTAQHAKLIPESHETFDELEAFFEEMVPLWSYASISFCWRNHAYPRVNSIVYELNDQHPPHPRAYGFLDETGIRKPPSDLSDEKLETYVKYQDAAENYSETDDSPRFEYGPSLILNGDYGAGGADITAYGIDTLEMDFRFETDRDVQNEGKLFPVTAWEHVYDRITDFLPDYPDGLDVTELTTDWNTVFECNTPQPLNPEPDEYTA